MFSPVLGFVDQVYAWRRKVLSSPRFFSKGWGDVTVVDAREVVLVDSVRTGVPPISLIEPGQVTWDTDTPTTTTTTTTTSKVVVRRGRFRSPEADTLPACASDCIFDWVTPASAPYTPWRRSDDGDGDGHGPVPRGVAILFPATAEQDAGPRLALAQKLAEQNVTSIIVTAPFYGHRKPPDQPQHFITTVQMFFMQSMAIMQEAALLQRFVEDLTAATTPVVFSGFSWGAAMSACAGTIALGWSNATHMVGSVPYVGSSSPRALLDGVLYGDLDWASLTTDSTHDAAFDRLADRMRRFHLSQFIDAAAAGHTGRRIGVFHSISMRHDRFVTPEWGHELFTSVAPVATDARESVHDGGHVTAFLRRASLQVPAILDAIETIGEAAKQAREGGGGGGSGGSGEA